MGLFPGPASLRGNIAMRKADKVALVGWWQETRELVPWDDPSFEIWGLNEAYARPWMKRWDRWFQVHGRWNFSRLNNPNDPNHFEWLKAQKAVADGGFPIYMQREWTDIPASTRFPLEDITQAYLAPYIKRLRFPGTEKELEEDTKGYYTSSVALMVAFALHEGFKEIHFYGFTMGSDTEYKYQRINGEFWIGLCAGRGVKIVLPDPCTLLTSSGMYGYEVTEMLGRQDLEFRMTDLKRLVDQKTAMVNTLHGAIQGLGKVVNIHPELAETVKPEMEKFELQVKAAENELYSVKGAELEVMNWLKTIDLQPTHPDFGKYVMGTEAEAIRAREGEALREFGREFAEPAIARSDGPDA